MTVPRPSPISAVAQGIVPSIETQRLGEARCRLLIISADFPPTKSAEADHAYHLAMQFARRGADVTVLTSATSLHTPAPSGLTVARAMARWSFADLPRLAAFLQRHRPSAILLVYLGTMYNHPMITFAPTLARWVVPGAAFVTQFENLVMTVDKTSLVTRAVWKAIRQWVTGAGTDYSYGTLLRDSRRVIVLCEQHRNGLREHCADIDGPSVLIPPAPIMRMCSSDDGLARRQGRAVLDLADDEIVLAYYGYIYRGKGVETMLQAFATLNTRRPEARLVIIGGFVQHTLNPVFASRSLSYEASVKDVAAALGIETKIIWAGHCPSTETDGSRYLRASDICVLPFDNGVQMNNSSFAAAAAHGLPILTTAGSAVETPIVNGENVLLCPPKDPAEMARAMERLVTDPDLRRRLARGAGVLAAEWFDWDRVVERIQATFSAG